MLGQAVGVQREFSGLMSKPWRMVALHLGAWITFALVVAGASSLRVDTDGARLDLPRHHRRLCADDRASACARIMAALRAKSAAR